jgi:hypothetical protein
MLRATKTPPVQQSDDEVHQIAEEFIATNKQDE